MFGFDINRVLSAYGGLCGRWVGANVDAGRRGTHQRFFKSILALPLAAAFAAIKKRGTLVIYSFLKA